MIIVIIMIIIMMIIIIIMIIKIIIKIIIIIMIIIIIIIMIIITMLQEHLQDCVCQGNVAEWMVSGRTVLIEKDPVKGAQASNYRPITYLPKMWKLLTGIMGEKLYQHLEKKGLLADEQKGCRKGSRRTKDQCL